MIVNEIEKIVNAYKKTKSIKGVKLIVGISEYRIRKILTWKGFILNDRHRKILKLHNQGKSPENIAEEVGMSEKVVRSYLPPVRPIYRYNQSPNAIKISNWRNSKKQI